MRSLILSLALISTTASIYCTTSESSQPVIAKTELSEYEVFAQKYEAAFGEKPSNQIWTLGNKQCGSLQCRTGCSTKCVKS